MTIESQLDDLGVKTKVVALADQVVELRKGSISADKMREQRLAMAGLLNVLANTPGALAALEAVSPIQRAKGGDIPVEKPAPRG